MLSVGLAERVLTRVDPKYSFTLRYIYDSSRFQKAAALRSSALRQRRWKRAEDVRRSPG